MNDHKKQIEKLNALLNKDYTQVSKGAENTQIKNTQNLATINNKYTDFSSKFNELPAFCEHLPIEFKNAMVSLKELHNTPYEFSLLCLLGMANTSTQHLYDVESYKYGIKPISLNIMILLGTGGSKSTVMGEIEKPFVEFQKRMFEALKNEDARFVSQMKLYKKKITQYEKDTELGMNPPFPTKPVPAETAFYYNSRFTVNGFLDILQSQPHASIISAEAGEFFSGHAFQGGKQDANRAVEMTTALTKFWDGGSMMRMIKDERVMIENHRINCFWMIQEGVIRDVLNNKTFQEQGFTHRLLIGQIQSFEKPNMSFLEEDDIKDQKNRLGLKPYLDKLTEILYKRPKMMIDRHYELDPTVIQTTREAKIYMGDFSNSCKHYGNKGNILDRYEGFVARIHEHTIRIAATLAAFNDKEHVQITIDEAKAAVDIMKLFIEHRAGLELGITDTRPELSQAASVLETWFNKHKDKSFTKRELSIYGPGGFQTISDAQRITILEELLSSEVLVATETVAKNNRKTVKFSLNQEKVTTV